MSQGTLKIHSENILPIIKRWLYSDKDIFVRELVSNATDACSKHRKLSGLQEDFRIDIKIDSENRTLTFSDNGIGMDHEEVEKYIAQIAFSGAEEFIKQYQKENDQEHIIGHFGLGFYSAYMVAEVVEIQTLSYKENSQPVFWSCDGSSTYTIEKGLRAKRGTDVILKLLAEEEEFLDAERIKEILKRYCHFLPYPIYLNEVQINEKPPLWIKSPAECEDKEYLEFYKTLFPMEKEPLFWIHLNIDYPFNLKGILYFPKISRDSQFKKETIQLYCNRVFVSDNCKDLLPDYLTILQGAIDSPDIPLNVSRSTLQMDRTFKQLASHISKKVTDRLSTLYRTQKEKFLSCWEDVEVIVKFGCLQEDKFYEKAQEFLIWKNSKGEWTTVLEYLERQNEKVIYYTTDEGHFLDLYRQMGIEVLFIRNSLLENAMIPFFERTHSCSFKRIDAHLDAKILDPSKEKNLLDSEGRSESAKIAEFFKKKLDIEHLEVEAKSLNSPALPAFVMMKEEERRFRDSLSARNVEMKDFSRALMKPTFVVNTNNKLIQAIHEVEKLDGDLAKQLAHVVHDLALLSQKEMDEKAVTQFIARSTAVLEQLAIKAIRSEHTI